MKKLKLHPETLAVESFPTGTLQDVRGTVQGRERVPTPPYFTCLVTKPTDCPCTPRI